MKTVDPIIKRLHACMTYYHQYYTYSFDYIIKNYSFFFPPPLGFEVICLESVVSLFII